jgi:hypothetical protein
MTTPEMMPLYFAERQQLGPFATACKTFTDLAKIWQDHIWPEAPGAFKERLKCTRELPAGFEPMEQLSTNDFVSKNTYDRILWDKITLTGVPCKDLSVRLARNYATRATHIQPVWEEIIEEYRCPDLEKDKLQQI